jgi:hypothetical protein
VPALLCVSGGGGGVRPRPLLLRSMAEAVLIIILSRILTSVRAQQVEVLRSAHAHTRAVTCLLYYVFREEGEGGKAAMQRGSRKGCLFSGASDRTIKVKACILIVDTRC